MDTKKKNFARFGMLAKGAVYCLIGVLTALAAFGQGGEQTGSTGSIQYLARQSYGQVLIIVLGIGLLGYVFWRMYQAFGNPQGLKDDFKGYGKRVAYFISGLIYGGLAVYALFLAFGSNASGGNSGSGLITGSAEAVIVLFVGIGLVIKAVYDLYRAYSGSFREDVEETRMSPKEQKLLINAGKFGHTSRGIVLGLMAFLTLKSGASSGGDLTSQTDAFGYIQTEFGSLVLGVVAIGFIGYGIYMFIQAKYPAMAISHGSHNAGIN